MMTRKTVAFHTLGCKLNYAETVTMTKQFVDDGYTIVPFGAPASVTVINTCSVTERADRECRQLIRRARRTANNSCIVVTGCYAQLAPEEVASIDGVHLVIGTKEKFNILKHLNLLEGRTTPTVIVSEIDSVDSFEAAFSSQSADRTRAYLKIQDGCDYNCTFCTIPLARGTSRSQNIALCVAQARALVASGYKEIVLTGVNVGDYGKRDGASLLSLLRELVRIDGLHRLRISSIEPNLLSSELLEFVASERVMCRHVHIPLQSGHDEILRAMRRRYTTGMYQRLIDRIKATIPECGIGVDIIVGFPGETQTHFDSTYHFLSALPVSYLHVFSYSERPNTPAASLPGQVRPEVRGERSKALRRLGLRKRRRFAEALFGRTVDVLLEGQVEGGRRYGLTDTYVRVGVPVEDTTENTILPVAITRAHDYGCFGEVVMNAPVAQ